MRIILLFSYSATSVMRSSFLGKSLVQEKNRISFNWSGFFKNFCEATDIRLGLLVMFAMTDKCFLNISDPIFCKADWTCGSTRPSNHCLTAVINHPFHDRPLWNTTAFTKKEMALQLTVISMSHTNGNFHIFKTLVVQRENHCNFCGKDQSVSAMHVSLT